jgi:hypothetical protein
METVGGYVKYGVGLGRRLCVGLEYGLGLVSAPLISFYIKRLTAAGFCPVVLWSPLSSDSGPALHISRRCLSQGTDVKCKYLRLQQATFSAIVEIFSPDSIKRFKIFQGWNRESPLRIAQFDGLDSVHRSFQACPAVPAATTILRHTQPDGPDTCCTTCTAIVRLKALDPLTRRHAQATPSDGTVSA